MSLNRFCVKFVVRAGSNLDEAIFIDIFHEWIRFHALPGILLDVADYRHVPEGPGVMLITHEINYALDHGQGRFGLLAQRKLGQATGRSEKILELLRSTITFAHLLEEDWRIDGGLQFEAGSFEFSANDRLLLPNTAEAFADIQPDLQAVAATLYPGREATLNRVANAPRNRLTITVASGASLRLAEVAGALGVAV